MTSPTSAKPRSPAGRGFTLIEMLVVVGIIAALTGLILVVIAKAMSSARRAATASELASIASALEQYHTDYADYPRVSVANTGAAALVKALFAVGPAREPFPLPPAFNSATSYSVGDFTSASGAAYECILANPSPSVAPPSANWQAVPATAQPWSGSTAYTPGTIVSYNNEIYVAVATSTGQTPPTTSAIPSSGFNDGYWSQFDWSDGAASTQYRIRLNTAPKNAYLQADRFKISGIALLDRNDHPILYFPLSAAKSLNVATARGYIADPAAAASLRKSGSIIDPADNIVPFRAAFPMAETNDSNSIQRLSAMLGDTNYNGVIDNGETAAAAAGVPFLLWAAGADGFFGPAPTAASMTDVGNVDDVTNFR